MKFNFKKISAIGVSLLLTGMTMGVAAAATYPQPFVSGGVADVAIVYGSAATLDVTPAGSIKDDLATHVSGSSVITGESADLVSGTTKIWLNTSLNTNGGTFTKSDLPNILGAYTFSGNVDSKITSTITVGANKVDFAKQPSSNEDPVLGVAMGTSKADPLYNASITMPAIAFNSTDSEGETIHLFGRDFVVSTATDATSLVLFSSAEEIALSVGGDNPSSKTVTVGGVDYLIELVTGSSTTSATIAVNGESKAITAGNSKKINGLEVALKSVTESTALNKIDVSLLIGSEKITFTTGTQVTKGSDDDPVDGTYVTFTGGPGELTGLDVAVYAPDTSNDALLAGDTFVDPVFGSFSLVFKGMNVADSDRETIKIDKSGDKGMSLTMTNDDGDEKTFDFIYNATTTFLGDSSSYKINLQEKASLAENAYMVIGNEDYGHLIQVTRIYNNTGTDYSKDSVTFKDVISGEAYAMDATGEGTGRLNVDGRQYTLAYTGTGDTGAVTITYPTSDSASTEYVVFPTIETENGALVGLYEQQTLTLSGTSIGFKLPDGDGYTTVTLTPDLDPLTGTNGTYQNWNLTTDGTASAAFVNTSSVTATGTILTVGQLTYNLNSTITPNVTTLTLVNPSTSVEIATPGVVIFEAKDYSSNYEAIIVYTNADNAGTSSDPVGIGTVISTSPTWYSAATQTDSDITEDMTWYGTLISEDSNTASQKVVTLSYPNEQVYADLALAEGSSTTAGEIGTVLYTDAETASYKDKNVIVVGGSCINAAAAALVGGAYCEGAWTTATGVGSGQYIIKGYATSSVTSKFALLVAGYNAADTVNAATYLRTQNPDLSVQFIGPTQ